MRPWIALYSQTGGELSNLCTRLGRLPDLVITNKSDNKKLLRTEHSGIEIIEVPDRPSAGELSLIFSAYTNPLVTLHGWMRIVPAEVCNKYEMYNGHPGLITEYPELKGKDPQDKAWKLASEGKIKRAGCVIHKVVPEVDSGQIILSRGFSIESLDKRSFFTNFRYISEELWFEFLKPMLK